LLAGLGTGLAAATTWSPPGGLLQAAVALLLVILLVLERGRASTTGMALIFISALIAGSIAGGERLAAIDAGATAAAMGSEIVVEGFTTAPIRSSRGVTRVPVETTRGRLLVQTSSRTGPLPAGSGIRASGTARPPPDWFRDELERDGIRTVLLTDRIQQTGQRRRGVTGFVDSLRQRAEDALGRQMPEREAALARGFVLGQDEGIDDTTKRDFQASGLAHLLAVSGQNVVLLGLLAIPFLALAGVGPRGRILVIAALIVLYVPLAGAGPSIQRAAVMGLAGLAAVAASRPSSRVYAITLAVVVTLGIDPRATTDIGWQLSFAAVIGIFLLAAPLQARLTVLTGSGGWRSGLVAGVAVTAAATLATAPLMAFHFERISLTSLAANLLALPAVAPAMWLGMLSAGFGQLSPVLAVPFNLLNSILLAYIAQVANWLGQPSWAELEVPAGGPAKVAAAYVVIGMVCTAALHLVTPESIGHDRPPEVIRRSRRIALASLLLLSLFMLLLPSLIDGQRRELASPPAGGTRIEVLDIGQGDAILIRPDGEDPVLIDGGPPGGDIQGALDSAGVEQLSAVILTHADLDHSGGLYEVLETFPVGRFLFDGVPRDLLSLAAGSGAETGRLAEGDLLRIGSARLEVLWPPPRYAGMVPPEDPNTRSVTVRLEVDRFSMLLTGDGEAEAVPAGFEPVDVLKVAHHGSDDAGLPALLDAAEPTLAINSSGAGNQYGHPTQQTTAALAEAGVPVERTDLRGTISVVTDGHGWWLETGP